MASASGYPVQLDLVAPFEVARWRPLVHWLLAIPQFAVLYVLQLTLGLLVVLAWFTILFTAAIPQGLFAFMTMVLRYQWRVSSYFLWMREPYPPFDFTASGLDPGDDPSRLSVAYPERLSRLLIFVKWILVIPHVVALFFVGIGAFVVVVAGFFAVLVIGRWPEGLRTFLVGVSRWSTRLTAYACLMTDRYPPFSLHE